ncbi:hypothetical protein AXG93_1774s1440 [Marchantia polymorpha subsp. ruderalis]|uniref:Uncharacterized protein n=1 Tax=Marchantia polymorpha subsp. ruderalis TaxID=1480154 RepID=A0A176W1U5_MARPO|nr:hypothetical protein AXG93_1774s1440 [Marchantia polymorpha subsp. ruderalis]
MRCRAAVGDWAGYYDEHSQPPLRHVDSFIAPGPRPSPRILSEELRRSVLVRSDTVAVVTTAGERWLTVTEGQEVAEATAGLAIAAALAPSGPLDGVACLATAGAPSETVSYLAPLPPCWASACLREWEAEVGDEHSLGLRSGLGFD